MQPGLALLRLAQGRLDDAAAAIRRIAREAEIATRFDSPYLRAMWCSVVVSSDSPNACPVAPLSHFAAHQGFPEAPPPGRTIPRADSPARGRPYGRIMSDYGSTQPAGRLVRPQDRRIIAGVCAGLAQRFGLSATVVRVLFLLFIVLPLPSAIIYLVLWLIMPNES